MLFPARRVLALGLLASLGASVSTLYSIGPDTSDTPRSFTSIPSGGPGLTLLFNLGTGLLGYHPPWFAYSSWEPGIPIVFDRRGLGR